jgi:hypothetical protein
MDAFCCHRFQQTDFRGGRVYVSFMLDEARIGGSGRAEQGRFGKVPNIFFGPLVFIFLVKIYFSK